MTIIVRIKVMAQTESKSDDKILNEFFMLINLIDNLKVFATFIDSPTF